MPSSPPPPRIERLAPGEDESAWAAALACFDPARAKPLKVDRDTAVSRDTLAGRDVVVKAWRLASFGARLKAAARASRAWRHWSGAERLARAGVATAACLVIARGEAKGRAGGEAAEWLVMETLGGSTVLDHLASGDLTPRQEHAVARAMGESLAKLVRARLFNRDHKPSNVIVTNTGASGREKSTASVAVIDCVAIRRGTGAHLPRMLASLMIEPTGCGCPPRLALRARVVLTVARAIAGERATREDVRASAQRLDVLTQRLIMAHGDPRPRVNPLARGERAR